MVALELLAYALYLIAATFALVLVVSYIGTKPLGSGS